MDKRWEKHPRLGGTFLLTVGSGLGYAAVYAPLQGARRHEAVVSLDVTGTVMSVLGITLGLFLLAFGAHARRWLQTEVDGQYKAKPAGVVFVVLVLLTALGIYVILDRVIAGYGYHG